MAYIKREIEKELLLAAKSFGCITIFGPRQVGKSTTINKLFQSKIKSITLDDLENRTNASNNPKQFLESLGWPLIIDEIQKVPQLLNEIKIIIDNEKYKRLMNNEENQLMFVLTGSNRFELQKYVSESLAGRTAVFEMNSLTSAEKNGIDGHKFFPEPESLLKISKSSASTYKTKQQIFDDIFKGGMPEYIDKDLPRNTFFSSYIDTYITRDIKTLIRPGMEVAFRNFMRILALRTGAQINYQDIANKVGIDVKTVKTWLSILKESGIIALLEPYMPNLSDRIIKTPKLYFMDTGLCAYLCGWPDARILEDGIMSGAFFENFVISDIIKNLSSYGVNPYFNLYYYRDVDQREVDLLYVDHRGLTPIEIKKSTSPNKPTKNFEALKKYKLPILTGLVIDCCEQMFPIDEKAWSYPVWRLGE